MNLYIALPIETWAAIVLEHLHEGFSPSDRGRAAQQGHEHISNMLYKALPFWGNVWQKS